MLATPYDPGVFDRAAEAVVLDASLPTRSAFLQISHKLDEVPLISASFQDCLTEIILFKRSCKEPSQSGKDRGDRAAHDVPQRGAGLVRPALLEGMALRAFRLEELRPFLGVSVRDLSRNTAK